MARGERMASISGVPHLAVRASMAVAPCLSASKTWTTSLLRSNTPTKVAPLKTGQLIGHAGIPRWFSSCSMRSRGSRPWRSILFTKVKMGRLRSLQTRKSFSVCGSTPLAASMSITAQSAAARVR